MNGIEKILEKIKQDCDNEIAAIEAETAEKCAAIRSEGDTKAREEYARLIVAGTEDVKAKVTRLGGIAALEAKKRILETKQETVSNAFARAVEMMAELDEGKYVDLLVSLVVKASETGCEQLIFSPSDRSHVGKTVCMRANETLAKAGKNAELRLSAETRDMRAGVVLSSGSVELNCSAEALTNQYRQRLAPEVAAILFS
ncbi:MAG: hypothetical protein HUJ65_07290 [Oscillospiraceae bacterium]|nr:hypothetical protein [Oscillospiraceae bacterium]